MIHTPVHASWLNQAEIVFIHRPEKVLSPSDFATTAQLAAALLAFIDRYNQTARPFNWKFTAADLAGSSSESAPTRNPPVCQRLPDKALAVSRAMSDRSVTLPYDVDDSDAYAGDLGRLRRAR